MAEYCRVIPLGKGSMDSAVTSIESTMEVCPQPAPSAAAATLSASAALRNRILSKWVGLDKSVALIFFPFVSAPCTDKYWLSARRLAGELPLEAPSKTPTPEHL